MACRLSFRENKNINIFDGRGVANVARVEEGVVDKLAVSLELFRKFNLDKVNELFHSGFRRGNRENASELTPAFG